MNDTLVDRNSLGIPNSDARLSILSAILTSIPNSLSRDELESVANQSHGYVGADLAAVCREAGLKCIKRSALLGIRGRVVLVLVVSSKVAQSISLESSELCVSISDIKEAIREIRPSAMREVRESRSGWQPSHRSTDEASFVDTTRGPQGILERCWWTR